METLERRLTEQEFLKKLGKVENTFYNNHVDVCFDYKSQIIGAKFYIQDNRLRLKGYLCEIGRIDEVVCSYRNHFQVGMQLNVNNLIVSWILDLTEEQKQLMRDYCGIYYDII